MKIIPLKSGDEQDALCRRSRKILCWRRGETKRIKRLHNRKIRRALRVTKAAE